MVHRGTETLSTIKLQLSRVLKELSNIQEEYDKEALHGSIAFTTADQPMCGLRASEGLIVAIDTQKLEKESPRGGERILCARSSTSCKEQIETLESNYGNSINMQGTETVFVLFYGSTIQSLSSTPVEGSKEFLVDYYLVKKTGEKGDYLAPLLPFLITNTAIRDPDTTFVYMHLRCATPYPLITPLHERAKLAAVLLFENCVSRSTLENCSDARRAAVLAGNVQCDEAELNSARVVKHVEDGATAFDLAPMKNVTKGHRHKTREALHPYIYFCRSRAGRDMLQINIQWLFSTHVAHMPECVVVEPGHTEMACWTLVAIYMSVLLQEYCDGEQRSRLHCEVLEEKERRQKVHDTYEITEKNERTAADLRRKLQADSSRKAAAESGPMAYTARREPARSSKSRKRDARKERLKGNSEAATMVDLEHKVHTTREQRELREQAFDTRQMAAHIDAEARHAREWADATKRKLAEESASRELARQHKPTTVTLFDAMGRPEF
jgi:hypothetical protein